MLKLALFLLLTSYTFCSGYKLLLVFPFPKLSHSVLGEGYVRNLLKAGHEVTYITPYPIKNATKGLRQIEVTNNTKIYPDETTLLYKRLYEEETETVLEIALNITSATVMHTNVQKLLNDDTEQFDAVIVEWMYSEVYAGFSSIFNCPLIWSSPMEPNAFELMLLNEHPNAYTPGLLPTFTANNPLSFWQRVVQQVEFLHVMLHRWLLSDIEKSLFNRAFHLAAAKRGGFLPPFECIKHNGSLLFGHSHFSTGHTFRSPLNYIQIAGYHIEVKRQPLSKNLKNIMEGSKRRVVYFSMGSILGNTLPDDAEAAILKVFEKINLTVIWQHEENLKTPKNVHVFKKVPQQSILAHPNCTLFITTGELSSIIEAIHFAVPIIGIPLAGDQFNNIDKAVTQGFAKKVNPLDITAIKAAIDDVLRNSKYIVKVKELSSIYHDRAIPPGKELLFWVEHVIRTKGALHLRSPVMLPWYYTAYLELIIVILIIVACFRVLIIYILRRRKNDDDLSFKKYI